MTRVERRAFIVGTLGLLAAPLAAEGQQTPMPEIGFLSSTSSAPYAPFVAAFLEGVKEVGFVAGRNVTIAYRWGDGQFDRLPALADDLVRRQVTVIAVGGGGVTAVAAKKATSTIPIVFAFGSDPIKLGLVASLNRPGGNVTGVTGIAVTLGQKRLELLRALLPDVAVVGFLLNQGSPNTAFDLPEMQAAARALGLRLIVVNASSEHEINKAFVTLAERRAAALVVQAEPFLFSRREQIVALAARHGIPAVYVDRVFPVTGGLMSYGSDFRDVNRQAGIYAGRILKGEKPANLPVVQSIKYELVINLKTAKALGLTIPPSVLARADEVIE